MKKDPAIAWPFFPNNKEDNSILSLAGIAFANPGMYPDGVAAD